MNMINGVDEIQAFGKENLEASIASATAMTKGMQTIAAECADFSVKAFEHGAQAIDKVMSAKTPEKMFEAQQNFAREAFESYVGQVNKLGEMYMSAARDCYSAFEGKASLFGGKIGR
ncbi:hypothetical protein FHS85_002972 [Rhodoligotrophos appendicifer]|uniref:phasin family protein n=1 Tax=Rhodoligotrophos appendicifer TaxID=987056 RepID=UPI001186BD8F|nr:phasin family protein [Rhodoligotrophos appendicifer]